MSLDCLRETERQTETERERQRERERGSYVLIERLFCVFSICIVSCIHLCKLLISDVI